VIGCFWRGRAGNRIPDFPQVYDTHQEFQVTLFRLEKQAAHKVCAPSCELHLAFNTNVRRLQMISLFPSLFRFFLLDQALNAVT
jgi:hypothetical protein